MVHLTRRVILIASFCMIAALGAQISAACTGVYVGPEASTDGTVIFGRSNDMQAVAGNHITVTKRVEKKSGRTMPVDENGTIQMELPATTYQYTATPWMDSAASEYGPAHDASACANECGVAMTMAVTAFANDAALAADPKVENGLTEDTATDLVICQSGTAREAVEVLLGIIDTYGSSECNVAMIADQKEAWLVEMYNGHQYAAVKLPADKVCAYGNEYVLEYLSDYEECITSKELTSLPEEAGFAVYGEKGRHKGELNLFETYSGAQKTSEYCHMRTWIGHQLLAPSQFGGDYDHDAMYPLCFTPDKKVSVEDVCEIMRNRYDGTKYSPDETGRLDMRVIGTDTALSVHVFQVFPDVPAEMSVVTWVSSGPAIYGVFVPVSNACKSVSAGYGANQPAADAGTFDTEHYAYYVMKALCTLCVGQDDWKLTGQPVRSYWHQAEQGMFAGMREVIARAAGLSDAGTAADYITSYCNKMQTLAFTDGQKLLNDVLWTQSDDSNTLKIARNPETEQLTGQLIEYPPMKVSLDPAGYAAVPDVPKDTSGGGAGHGPVLPLLGAAAAAAVILEAIALARARRREE